MSLQDKKVVFPLPLGIVYEAITLHGSSHNVSKTVILKDRIPAQFGDFPAQTHLIQLIKLGLENWN